MRDSCENGGALKLVDREILASGTSVFRWGTIKLLFKNRGIAIVPPAFVWEKVSDKKAYSSLR